MPAGAGHATIFPYGPYRTADGTVLFGLQNPREWRAFCLTVIERPDLADDPDLAANAGRAARAGEIDAAIDAVLSRLSTAEAVARLEAANIGTASVNDMAAVWQHPQLAARGRWRSVDTPAGPVPALALVGGSWPPRMGPVPALGEHTEALRAEFAPPAESPPE